jgi:hypothetical protein
MDSRAARCIIGVGSNEYLITSFQIDMFIFGA